MVIQDDDIDSSTVPLPSDEYHLVHAPDTDIGELMPLVDGTTSEETENDLRHWAARLDAVRRALGRKL